ncbi:MAG: metallophosphoesterase [Patescibacteria group bacterium]|nr:metallophosphoesterase [Patescibacteria group bacterium]
MAGLIFTGDLQADISNLESLEKVFIQIENTMSEKAIEGVVLLGDLKQRYNPIDGRVLNFIIEWVVRFKNVFILLGNHDRFSLQGKEESWLSALEKAGAKVFSKPRVTWVRCGKKRVALYMLPYRANVSEVKKQARRLRVFRVQHKERADLHVLCFHQGLKEAKYTDEVSAQGETLSVEDLYPQNFDYVLGSHLHLHQQVRYENTFYTGSPFAMDWGEVNSKKGFLILEV